MAGLEFNFGNAISHYSKTGGPRGFLWKYALVFGLVTLAVQAVAIWLQWPIYEMYLRMITEGGDIESHASEINRMSATVGFRGLWIMPLGILSWVVFEGANQRRYMRGDGFSLRLGADEGRLFIVGLIWFALFIGLYIGLIIAMFVPLLIGVALGQAGAMIGAIVMILSLFGFVAVALWIAARLSAAAALTVRDQEIRFFESWKVTKGKGWTIVGAWIVLFLIIMVVFVILYLIAAALGFGILGAQVPGLFEGNADEAAVSAAITSPAFWGPLLLVFFFVFLVQAAFQHIISGPAALAARTDDDWAGADLAGEFV
ncbi:MAG: hypothetical protein R3C13_08905 [Hyphomonas sp.]|uniref:hypothetical protein n=1 Tax=Hyphomonas sp. TaxID=87 RepID=UPI003527967C